MPAIPMPIFETQISAGTVVLLGLCLLCALAFEFANGFHDTANAVATVIYTKALKPTQAVMLSGFFNFLGVLTWGIAVAMNIMHLLPAELLVKSGVGVGLAMALALLGAAIVWNVGTWYLGIPASSSHTLIGSILGVGLANSTLPGHTFGAGVNWGKASEVGMSLLVSPLIGFGFAFLLLLLAKKLQPESRMHRAPKNNEPPPWWIRLILIGTCSGVSWSHGSNDGQKGVGIIMIILIGILPVDYALNPLVRQAEIDRALVASVLLEREVAAHADATVAKTVSKELSDLRATLVGKQSMGDVLKEQRAEVRRQILSVDEQVGKLVKGKKVDGKSVEGARKQLRGLVDFAPLWVKLAIALALGIGTMVGWKRIVVTIGEKIGKSHLTYAQGASAELVAMTTIALSTVFGWPVSTTHVLSSGVAGTMAAANAGVQAATMRKIAAAWILTLPVTMLLSGVLFLLFRAALS